LKHCSLCVALSVSLSSLTPATVRYFADRLDSSSVFHLRFCRLPQLQATFPFIFRMAEAAAALQAQINAAVVAALAAQAAAAIPAPVAHVAVKLPDFWVKDPKMWFSQAEAQFRCARITAETTMYDYVLMKLPQDVVMSVRALVLAIEADPVSRRPPTL
jgi:hypothetical protein